MAQLALALAVPPEPSFDNYFPARNTAVVALLRQAAGHVPPVAGTGLASPGTERFIYLWGPRGVGKSHLLRAFVAASRLAGRRLRRLDTDEATDAVSPLDVLAVDDADKLGAEAQLALFDAFNRFRVGRGTLVTCGALPPLELPLREDLRTRLGSGVIMRLEALTDEEKAAALSEEGRRRGLNLGPDMIEYLLNHAPRDMGTQMAMVTTLDRVALERKRPLSLPLLRDVLRELGTAPLAEDLGGSR